MVVKHYLRDPSFLANVNSRSHSLYAVACPSVICMSSVTFVRSTQPVEIFGNFSTPFRTFIGHPLTSVENFTEIVPGEALRRGS